MKRKKLGFMNIKHELLSRSEMKQLVAGNDGSCTLTCDNCNNSTCQTTVPYCSQEFVYQLCGPGEAGGSGPGATCVC